MANNEVLANLQRAYLAADDSVRFRIRQAWRLAKHGGESEADADETDAEIRAWQPEQPDPLAELTRWVATLERGLATLSNSVQTLDAAIDELSTLESPQPAPEPDDPVCARDGCGHPKSQHNYHGSECDFLVCRCKTFLPAPPAAPLDPESALMPAIRKWGTAMNKVGYVSGQNKSCGYESSMADAAYDEMVEVIRAYGVPS